MSAPLVVLDTNVLVAAIRSRRGASFAVLSLVGTGAFEIVVSVPLLLEYEDAMLRGHGPLGDQDIRDILDYICSVAKHQEIFFLWRPRLRDPKDDMVAEVAFAARAEAIVTHNRRDFAAVDRLGVSIFSPNDLLRKVK